MKIKKSLILLILIIFILGCAKEPIVEEKDITREPVKEEEIRKQEEIKKEEEYRQEERKIEEEKPVEEPFCQNECASFGLHECYGDGLHICGNYDADDCLEWGIMIPCGEGYACSDGYCVFQQEEIQPPPTPPPPAPQDECSIEETGLCEELISGENTASPDKLNLIFAGVDFDKEIVRGKALTFLFDEGQSSALLNNLEPFKSNKDKFNLWVINKISHTESEANELIRCCQLQNWYGYIYVKNIGPLERSFSGFGPNASTTLYVTLPSMLAVGPAVHETGHLVGGLHDEYRGGRQQEPASYVHMINSADKNLFYNPSLDDDNFVSVQECRDNTHWKDWIGKGCGDDNSVDCIDKYVFHKTYVLWDKPLSDPSKQDLQWATLEDEYCDYGNEENCFIELNGELINPFDPGEGFVSVIQEGSVYRQEMFSHDILCKPEYAGYSPDFDRCQNEVDCFVGGGYHDYNIYRPTFQSRMAGGAQFGSYNEYLIQQKINQVLEE
ncbi:MAG: hypothetical protein KAT77_03170 [Nanoarchaeota archaeon]|nr:hypothetical protein [Nanoarchaeota archaeon]